MKPYRWEYLFFLTVSAICLAADRPVLAASSNAPVFAVKTAYNGLIYREDGALPGETGYFRIDVSRNGSFTGRLLVGPQRAQFHGRFNEEGTAYVPVKVGTGDYELILTDWGGYDYREIKKLKWTLILQLTNGLNQVAGQILSYAQTGWSANVLGDRARDSSPANPAPQAGRYTLVVLPNPDDPGSPEGDGCATVSVAKSGNIRLLGSLPDGSRLTTSAILSEEGMWPLFASLRAGKGMLVGWLSFTNSVSSDMTGQLLWMQLSQPRALAYRQGFTNETSILASRYVRPAGPEPVLALTNAALVLRGGELRTSFTNSLSFQTSTELTGSPGSGLVIRVSPSTGLFMGRTEVPGSARVLGLTGAILQKQTAGFGYFLGPLLSGEVIITQLP